MPVVNDLIATNVATAGSLNDKLIAYFSGIYRGSGSPEGLIDAPKGSTFQDVTTPAIYIKTTNTGTLTGWVAFYSQTQVDTLLALKSAAGRRFKTGKFYTFDRANSDSTIVLTDGVLLLAGFSVPFGATFNLLSLECTVAAANSVVHGLLYATDSGGYPTGAPLIDVTLTTTGTGTLTGSTGGPWVLPAGNYQLGALAIGGGPTVRSKGMLGTDTNGQDDGGNANVTGLALGGQASVPSSPAVLQSQSGTFPKVMLRAA